MSRFAIAKFGLGLWKSPYDKRDFLIRGYLEKEKIILPKEYDITHKMTPVRSQGQEGACTGFAGATGCKEYFEQIDYHKFIELSPRFLYEEAKKISGHKEGSTLRAIMQVLKNIGVCEEEFFPYQVPQIFKKSPIADTNASKYKIRAYARILNLEELKQSLVQFGTILAGIYVYKSISKTRPDGIVPTPNKLWPSNWQPIGGHAITICGFSDKTNLIKFKNSWSEGWGEKGYGYLSYRYAQKGIVDAYSMVDINDPLPYSETLASLSIAEGKRSWV